MFFSSFLSGLIARFFSGFGQPGEVPPAPAPTQTIAEIALGNENFEVLVAALSATNGLDGLLDAASNPAADITVFAPTDAAFQDLVDSLGIDVAAVVGKDPEDVVDADIATALASVLGAETVSQVLKYHVSVAAKTVTEIEEAGSVTTLVDGPDLATTFSVEGGALVDADPELENPEFIDGLTDLQATNGVIQAIDKVLLPVDVLEAVAQPTIADIALGNEDFEILVAALVATNDINGLLDAALSPDADVTVFAPTDDAFKALAASLDIDVATVLGKAPDEVVDADVATALATVLGAETVSDVLKYHVKVGGDRVADLQEEQVVETLLPGSPLIFDGDSIVDAAPGVANPNLIEGLTDIEAANGQIQAIDGVLLPIDLAPENLRLVGSFKDDVLQGGGADDKIIGLFGEDVINGGAGDDNIRGNVGNDTLLGGAGDDTIRGGWGDDEIVGGQGNDLLIGNGGEDVFVFADGDGHDVIRNFQDGHDLIDLSGTSANSVDDLSIEHYARRVLIEIDDEQSIWLSGRNINLTEDDFIF